MTIMATIAKIKTASGFKYKAHIKVDGKNVKIKTFTRKTDARTWAKRIEADHELMESLGCKGAGLALKELAKEGSGLNLCFCMNIPAKFHLIY